MGLKHQAAFARKWRAAIRQIESHLPQALPPIFFLTDPDRVPDPVFAAHNLPRQSSVIYRHFGADDREDVADRLRCICTQHGSQLLIAADPELALKVGADGVHWPEALVSRARTWRGAFQLQTASAHSPRAIRRAAKLGMDAVLYSAVFKSRSASAGPPIGPIRVRRVVRSANIPIYALGGVDAINCQRLAAYTGMAAIDGLAAN